MGFKVRQSCAVGLLLSSFFVTSAASSADTSSPRRIPGHVPIAKIAAASHIGRADANTLITLSIPFTEQNPQAVEDLITQLHNPSSPNYGKYLTPEQYAQRFGTPQADYDSVIKYLQEQGFQIVQTYPNRMLITVQGSVAVIERAFQTEIHNYKTSDGRAVFAPTLEPMLPGLVADKIVGIIGLDNFDLHHTHLRKLETKQQAEKANFTGSGPNGYMIISDIRTAYNVASGMTGSGQTLALVEFDGYTASDITGYAQKNKVTVPNLTNELVDGFNGKPGSGAIEVTLDIEMFMAMAPASTKILVYEAPNTNQASIDILNKIATDNLAPQISTSWGLSENQLAPNVSKGENTALKQMAAQGQAFFAAAGDSGAYDDGSYGNGNNLTVDDPGSQPYAVSVGGTTLTMNSNATYSSESSWGDAGQADGGGGGISASWSIPAWQMLVPNSTNMASSTMRNVPDVSLNANPNSGYDIFFQGAFVAVGGTSAAAPLWAAFTADVNQMRVSSGLPTIGAINQAIYLVAGSSLYSQCFHDINDNSTNLYYHAVTGYDLSTGWGSFNATALASALSVAAMPPAAPAALNFQVISSGQ